MVVRRVVARLGLAQRPDVHAYEIVVIVRQLPHKVFEFGVVSFRCRAHINILSQTGKLLLKLLAGRRTARQYSHGPDVLLEDIRRDIFVHPVLPTGEQVLDVISITAHLARGSDHCLFASERWKRVRRYPESVMLPLAKIIDQWPVSHESIHLRLVLGVP